MSTKLSTGWMKIAIRGQICRQCDPEDFAAEPEKTFEPRPCEAQCAFFTQLPRLARFLRSQHAHPPLGYEDHAIRLLRDSCQCGQRSGKHCLTAQGVDRLAHDALATLEKVSELQDSIVPLSINTGCVRQSLAGSQRTIRMETRS